MLVSFIWYEADINKDDTVSVEEAQRWASVRVPLLTATLDGESLPLQLDELQFPSSQRRFSSLALKRSLFTSPPYGPNTAITPMS